MRTDIIIPVPKGWVCYETDNEITITGSLPDKDIRRNARVQITFVVQKGVIQHVGKLRVWCEVYRGIGWDFTKQQFDHFEWRKGGFGGTRLACGLLWHLAHHGSHL